MFANVLISFRGLARLMELNLVRISSKLFIESQHDLLNKVSSTSKTFSFLCLLCK